MVERIFRIIRSIHRSGTTMLLVEQNARTALALADRAYVVETGRIVLSGPSSALLDDPKVRTAYLGEVTHDNAGNRVVDTALRDAHRALGAARGLRGVGMPISYAGAERARGGAGRRPVRHRPHGDRHARAGRRRVPLLAGDRPADDLRPGAARYALVCNERRDPGDIFVYRRGADEAGDRQQGQPVKIVNWIGPAPPTVTVVDRTPEVGPIALKGPAPRRSSAR
jgi:hypothetical protein